MAIHIEEEQELGGISMNKEISATAHRMTLDLLQKYQYQYPIKSTVRELVSNGIDSIAEREVAVNILTGVKTVEDYFVNLEGEEYQDSKFDATYYDLQWLSDDNKVYIEYHVGNDLEKDHVVIKDNGVGLGSYRLEKYFSLGYSTKRLSKLPLGKFGIGGKAGLSVGFPYFTMESRYNGKKFRFNIYSQTIDSIIPKFNLEKSIENEHIVFNEGTENEYTVYYEQTDEKNGVELRIDAKKSHKQQYIDAVRSQLLYFDNVDFRVFSKYEEEWLGTIEKDEPISYKAKILYEDDFIILSDNTYWSKPHILLNKVNYGYVNFDELELEAKTGNIGIKIAPEDVDINPSRESIIWSDRTKEIVQKRFRDVIDIASKFIQDELKEIDYIKWIRACYSLTGDGFTNNTIISRLARIIDVGDVKPSFIPEPKLKFHKTKIFNGLYVRHVKMEKHQQVGRIKHRIDRKEIRSISNTVNLPIYLMKHEEKAGNRKDKYLYSMHHNEGGFLMVSEPMTSRESLLSSGATEETTESFLSLFNKEGDDFRSQLAVTWEFIKNSSEVQWYENVPVPDSFIGTDTEEDETDIVEELENKKQKSRNEKEESAKALIKALNKEKAKEAAKIAQQTRLDRRKAEGKILLYTPRSKEPDNRKPLIDTNGKVIEDKYGCTLYEPQRLYDWQKMEVPIRDMNDWTSAEIYYATGPEFDPLFHFVSMLTRDAGYMNELGKEPIRNNRYSDWDYSNKDENIDKISSYGVNLTQAYNCQHFFDNEEIMLIKASNANARYIRDFQHITQFFQIIRNNTITMSNLLIRWNTARLVEKELHKVSFLFNFKSFSPQHESIYKRLREYVQTNYREVNRFSDSNYFGLSRATYDDLILHLDKVKQMQDYVNSGASDEEIAQMARTFFNNKDIEDGYAVEQEVIDALKKVLDYALSTGPLLNYIPILTGIPEKEKVYNKGTVRNREIIPDEFELELKSYLLYKGVEEDMDIQVDKFYGEISSPPVQEYTGPLLPTVIEHDLDTSFNGTVQKNDQSGLTDGSKLEIPPDQAVMQEF